MIITLGKQYKLYSLLSLLLLAGCKTDYADQQTQQTTARKLVTVHKLTAKQSPLPITTSGILQSDKEPTLAFKIGGIVDKILVSKGQTVSKGQLLTQLDLSEINAQVNKAKNNFQKAERDLKRVTNLFEDSVATLEQKQDARTNYEVKQAHLEIASFNQKYAKIVAPVSGKILERYIEQGELVNAGQPILKLATSGKVGSQVITVGLTDTDITNISLGDSATVSFDPFPGKIYFATVTEIAESAHSATGTFSVELTLNKNYYKELKNGFVGKVKVYPSQSKPYFQIPITSIVEADKKFANVFITTDHSTVQKYQLKVDRIFSNFFTSSDSLLASNQWVVLSGASYLAENDSIKY